MKTDIFPSMRIILPEGFDERRQFETPLRGYLSDVVIEMEDARRYSVYFIDPIRLQQDLDAAIKTGQHFLAYPGLIVLPQVTLEAITEIANQLWRDGYFENLQPLKC